VIHCVMLIARDQPVAAGRVRIEHTAGLHGEVGGLLHRLDRKVPCRVDHDATLAAHPGDDRGPVFVIMAPTGLALLPATTCSAPQRFLPPLLRLPLVASGLIQVVGFDRPRQLPLHLIGQGRIASPPAPAIARTGMDPVWLKISAVSTPLKLLRLGVYWTARSRHGLHPEEGL